MKFNSMADQIQNVRQRDFLKKERRKTLLMCGLWVALMFLWGMASK